MIIDITLNFTDMIQIQMDTDAITASRILSPLKTAKAPDFKDRLDAKVEFLLDSLHISQQIKR